MVAMSLIPGLPMVPFLLCAAIVASISASAKLFKLLEKKMPKAAGQATLAKQAAFKDKLEKKVEEAKKQKSLTDRLAPTVVPIGIDLDPVLSLALGFEDEESDDDAELVATYIPQLRDALYLETGVRFPGVRVRPHVRNLPESSFMVRINDVPVLQDRLPGDHFLATAHPDKLVRLGITAPGGAAPCEQGEDVAHHEGPEGGRRVRGRHRVERLGHDRALRRVGPQEAREGLHRPPGGQRHDRAPREGVPRPRQGGAAQGRHRARSSSACSAASSTRASRIRDMKSIIEALGEFGTRDGDGLFLTEKVRAALGAQLAHSYAGLENRLAVLLLDPVIEDTIAGSISQNMHGQVLSLEPEICREIIADHRASLSRWSPKGLRPVVLTNAEIRRFVRKLLETDLPRGRRVVLRRAARASSPSSRWAARSCPPGADQD
jgi:type III secretion protein V